MRVLRTALGAGLVTSFCIFVNPGLCQTRSESLSDYVLEQGRVSYLLGMKVEDPDGEKVGTLKNLIVDMESGRVIYAMISSGGLPGLRQSKPVPPQLLSLATAKARTLAFKLSKARWEQGPTAKKADLAKPGRAAEIYEYYGLKWAAMKPDRALTRPGPATSKGLPHKSPQASPRNWASSSELLGKRVSNAEGESVGIISDLLVDLPGAKPALAVISAPKWSRGNRQFAVKLTGLRSAAKHKFMLQADRRSFEQAKPLTDQHWADAHDSALKIYWMELEH